MTHVTSIYIQKITWHPDPISIQRVAYDQLQWRVWTPQIFIIIMLLLPYFPTAFAFASCYDSQTTNTLYPFSNPSIWRVTRSLPMKGADTCEWNIFQKNSRFVGSFASFSLSVLLQYHAHPSNGCERTFPIHRHGHTLDTRKPCHQVAVTSSNEAKCYRLPFYLILLWGVLPCGEEQHYCPDTIFRILGSDIRALASWEMTFSVSTNVSWSKSYPSSTKS